MSASYDRAITVFSPDGHLFQVEYAQEAVEKGSTALAVKGKDVIVLAVEKKAVAKLQEDRTVRKICSLDDHILVAFAGLTADARVLINRARIECQSHRLSLEDAVNVPYITRYIARIKQQYTQSNGRRPFGISCLIAGFDPESGEPRLFQTDPSGTYFEWKANAIGRNGKTVREYLEKKLEGERDKKDAGGEETKVLKLAVGALMEVVQSRENNMEVAICRRDAPYQLMPTEELEKLVKEIQQEKEKEAQSDKDKSKKT
ncbi:proteasome subunit alpha type-7-like [Symsagittifera roscoffensis]|uniref:proteasome subunit alpha type-7-like n=1 Tax=Symsagittifera roscoffensis TaxID=84072 RepID=UPI00307B8C0E